MSTSYNYKLIYEARKNFDRIDTEDSFKFLARRSAEEKAKQEYDHMANKLTKLLGTDDWEISPHYRCMAEGIDKHVWSPARGKQNGLGHKKCVFCGQDDFND